MEKKIIIDPVIELSLLTESAQNKKKTYFFEGIFMQSEIINGNGRKYQKMEMEKEIERYNREKIAKNAGFGELDHPSTINMNYSKMCHLFVTPLRMEGNNCIGKAEILDTIWGDIVKCAIDRGIPFAVSSRGRGKSTPKNDHFLIEEFELVTPADIVENPSAPGARPTPFAEMLIETIMTNDDAIKNVDAEIIKEIQNNINNTKKSLLDEAIQKAYWDLINIISNK